MPRAGGNFTCVDCRREFYAAEMSWHSCDKIPTEKPMPKIDFTKPVRTKDAAGKEQFEITDSVKRRGYISYDGENWYRAAWNEYGECTGTNETLQACAFDLVQTPEKRVMYLNVFNTVQSTTHATRSEADEAAKMFIRDRSACVRLELVEGQFDE